MKKIFIFLFGLVFLYTLIVFSKEGNNNILIIGDSFVKGSGVQQNYGWAQRLEKKYTSKTFEIIGNGGENILRVLKRRKEVISKKFNVIILEIGINDSSFRKSLNCNEVSQREFEYGLENFVKYCKKENNNVKIYFIGITRVDENLTTPFKPDIYYYNDNIDVYNEILKDKAKELKIGFVSLSKFNEDSDCLSKDGLHPTDKGYQLIYYLTDKIIFQ